MGRGFVSVPGLDGVRPRDGGDFERRDNTLLSRLGFGDPDKQLPEHDLACQYLEEVA